jgi:hypothetical protein
MVCPCFEHCNFTDPYEPEKKCKGNGEGCVHNNPEQVIAKYAQEAKHLAQVFPEGF